MKQRSRLLVLLAVCLSLTFLVACGGNGDSEGATTQRPTIDTSTRAPSSASAGQAATPASSRATGGVFRRLWADPPTLDPHLANDTTSAGLIVEVFSGLVTITPDLTLAPDIAERWDVSPDGKTYTFYLRRNAKFHDGKQVTAQDFKWSFERATDPKLLAPVADTYLGEIVGVKERIRSQTTEISGVRVIDDFTLQIQTIRPTAYFIAMMSYPTSFVLDRANVEQLGRNWTSKPNGTGPFKLREYRIGERLVLERNPNYYRSPAKLDRVEYILSGGAAMAMYENNETEITGVGLADLDRVRDPKDPLNKDLHMAPPGFDISYIGFNTSRPPFDDPNVRRALNLATNKKLIADQVLANLVIPAYGILPPGFPGYTGKVTGLDFDAEKARATLVASRYANQQVKGAYAKYLQAKDTAALDAFKAAVKSAMPRTVVTVPGTGGGLGLDLEVITEMWRQTLGFEVEFQQVEWATFLQDLNGKKLQMFSGLGWQADYPDPQNFLDVLFHSESEINHGAYSNRQLDGILEQARTEPDWNRRVELYRQAEQLVLEDAPWVPLWFSSEAPYLLKPYVKGFVEAPLIVPKMAYVSIEKS